MNQEPPLIHTDDHAHVRVYRLTSDHELQLLAGRSPWSVIESADCIDCLPEHDRDTFCELWVRAGLFGIGLECELLYDRTAIGDYDHETTFYLVRRHHLRLLAKRLDRVDPAACVNNSQLGAEGYAFFCRISAYTTHADECLLIVASLFPFSA